MGRTWSPAVAVPTLVGSLLSFTATSSVIALWIVTNGNKRSFRYALVLNLAFAECINSFNNSVSGLYVALSKHDILGPGLACNVNGWVGQVSVQAADLSILAIAVVTLLALQFKSSILHASFEKKFLICLSVWLIPLITGTVALALDKYRPVSGNWCWIDAQPVFLRYVLGHGWRYSIFMATFVIYFFVFRKMGKRLRKRGRLQRAYSFYLGKGDMGEKKLHVNMTNKSLVYGRKKKVTEDMFNPKFEDYDPRYSPSPSLRSPETASLAITPSTSSSVSSAKSYFEKTEDNVSSNLKEIVGRPKVRVIESSELDTEIWNMFLLNLYPLTYVILWMSGILNRLVEASGHHSQVLAIMQSSTQYTGFVNALVYGFREHRGFIKRWLGR